MWQKIEIFFKNKSKIDSTFLLVLMLILCLPLSHINLHRWSKFEHRQLVKWNPPINKNLSFNINFGKDFDNWFNDRFNGRKSLIGLYNSINFVINQRARNYIIDKEHKSIYKSSELSHKKIEIIKENLPELYKFNKFCEQNNIKLYVLISPIKGDIYETKYANKLVSVNYENKKHRDFLEYIKSINKEDKIKVIYPYEKFKSESFNNKLYYKNEHHWTDSGAFLAYKELMKEIKKDYPNVHALQQEDFYLLNKKVTSSFNTLFKYRDYCRMLALPCFMRRTFYKDRYTFYLHKKNTYLSTQEIDINYLRGRISKYPFGANDRVILLGTSNIENFEKFISFTFKNVEKIRINGVRKIKEEDEFKIIKNYEKEILNYKPDILILCISYTNLTLLHKIFEKE